MDLYSDAKLIIDESVKYVLPDEAVKRAVSDIEFPGRIFLVSIGKAAWRMADAAYKELGEKITDGIVITKYGHISGPVGCLKCFEAGHPVPDENSFKASEEAIRLVSGLKETDSVLFLISGGGSALFEKPLVSGKELADITDQLLACGADITEINCIRKRLSAVKGGRFAKLCEPAKVYTVILSDIIGDPLDMIASGPAAADSSSCSDALNIIEKYNLNFSDKALALIKKETPKEITNVENHITGSVRQLCKAAKECCERLGYEAVIKDDALCCEAKDAGKMLAELASENQDTGKDLAFIFGGETVVHLTGKGKGGRNQEMALSCADKIRGMDNVLMFSIGSDGTDGPTDAAGGVCSGKTAGLIESKDISIAESLADNDSYNALKAADALIITGPTGTNVNDLSVLLIRSKTADVLK